MAQAEEASEKEAILRAEIETENAENLRKLRQRCEEAAAAAERLEAGRRGREIQAAFPAHPIADDGKLREQIGVDFGWL